MLGTSCVYSVVLMTSVFKCFLDVSQSQSVLHLYIYFLCLCLSEQLNGVNLQGFTSQEVLDVMRQTGQTVNLTLVRKIASPKKSSVEISLDKGEHHAAY